MRQFTWFLMIVFGLLDPIVGAAPVKFELPAQSLDKALQRFSEQAKVDVLYSQTDVATERSRAVEGVLEPAEALSRLLDGTLLEAKTGPRGGFLIKRRLKPTGGLRGQVVQPDGTPIASYRIFVQHSSQLTYTDASGQFILSDLAPGYVRLRLETGAGRDPVSEPYRVDPGQVNSLEPWVVSTEPAPFELAPMQVEDQVNRSLTYSAEALALRPRTAVGNLDLPRHEDGPLGYTIFRRDHIARSGVTNLNEYLQREMLDADGANRAPTAGSGIAAFLASSNLSLRGFDPNETVILINGRRLPEVVTSDSSPLPPDVNFVPLSMVEQVEVLPTSASSLYMGNPVGGVVNVVLRPEQEGPATEINTTYGNSLGGFDAANTSFSLLHARSLAGGKVRLRIHAGITSITPPTEAELRHHAPLTDQPADTFAASYRATPVIRTVDGSPLLASNPSSFASVGAGTGGDAGPVVLNPGVVSPEEFSGSLGRSPSIQTRDYLYGAAEKTVSWMGALVWDPVPWLQVGVDAFWSRRTLERGTDILAADLLWRATSPGNPFGQDVKVSLLESLSRLGPDYNRAQVDYGTIVGGVLVRPWRSLRLSFDAQYSRNTTRMRSLSGFGYNEERWEELLNLGKYDPLRDTRATGPSADFYNSVLIYREGTGKMVQIGDYSVLDLAVRGVLSELPAPGGEALVHAGFDYRSNHLEAQREQPRYGDGSDAGELIAWAGRTLPRYSAFAEVQAPLLPNTWRVAGIRAVETDLAVRYIAADTSRETHVAPTAALKVDFAGGFSVRGSLTYANRYPTPRMSRRISDLQPDTGSGVEYASILDPLRPGPNYFVRVLSAVDPRLRPESTVTQTAGILWQKGSKRRWRVSLDFVDTTKEDEHVFLSPQTLLYLEGLFPERVTRAPGQPADNGRPGPVTSVLTGTTNAASRESQNWNLSLSHRRESTWGGTFEVYGRWLYFHRYTRTLFPNEPAVDELDSPDGTAPGLLRHRGKAGVSWSRRESTFGLDWRYYHRRVLPEKEWALQGAREVGSHWESDVFVQQGLRAFFPRLARWNITVQLRVNNVFGREFPKYAAEQANTGVQAYGDWRGRAYSLNVKAEF
ncbi:MAG: TonB-dependent receptor plug domain-containing protein [Opitutaceae bacterium]|nr:TonB-dependent receptor plug domain-containing protein [Opitutaceae bacterium]